MLIFVGALTGPGLRPGGDALERPVFSKTGIDSHSDDGFNSVAVAAAVWYCKPVGYCNSCVAVVVVKTSRRRICRP